VSPEGFRTVVDVETLAAHLGRSDWLVCDVRHQLADPSAGQRAYEAAHLPGAVFLHLDHDLSSPPDGSNGRHPLPDPGKLAQTFGRIGIDSATQVVVYDDAGGMIAGRLWWLLRWLGHDRVALLDGGFQAWLGAGQPTDNRIVARTPRNFEPALRDDMRVDAGAVLANLGAHSHYVVDARSPDRFRGENEILDPVGGHIPGAGNRFFRDNLQADGRMKSPEVLQSEWLAACGGFSTDRLIHQCGSGVSACLNMIALEHAGLPAGRLYAGSWSEWCTPGANRPVATG
jgi:thiosulfate/3-mercaptopyruvate sulfurtransferase